MIKDGRKTFRNDTFGDEAFWGQTLQLHKAVAGVANGGVGPGLSPAQALALGLKVDVQLLPSELQLALAAGQVNLNDPAVTIELLRLKAVLGVTGFITQQGQLESIGIQCALCHSTVDDSFAPGIGKRLDGWANRDLDVGSIIAFAPDLSSIATLLNTDETTVRQVLHSWGPGKFDAALLLDGKAMAPNGTSGATLIPPAFGLVGVNLHTWTGWGSVTHWNAFVATIEMHGKGTFFDPRLDDATQFPIAARAGFGHIQNDPDRVTPKLAALHFFQLALPAPKPPETSFNHAAAERGDELFEGKAACNRCHVEPLFTEPGWNLPTGAEIGIDNFQADRSPDKRYRTTPLRGLWSHQKGGFFHDGRFATLLDVVNHYNQHFQLGLTPAEKNDLVEYLKSI
ncbi:MAG TPA: hypothetical protein VK843_09620 [Planctomycetota bacterium]|nr:hypothetical protein [Planctomycetota bacterium]